MTDADKSTNTIEMWGGGLPAEMIVHFFRVLMPRCTVVGDGFSRNDGTFFQGTDATVGDGFSRNDGTFFQGADTLVGDGFAPLGPALLPWENRMGRGQTHTHTHKRTSRLLDQSGPRTDSVKIHSLAPHFTVELISFSVQVPDTLET